MCERLQRVPLVLLGHVVVLKLVGVVVAVARRIEACDGRRACHVGVVRLQVADNELDGVGRLLSKDVFHQLHEERVHALLHEVVLHLARDICARARPDGSSE